MTVIIQPDNSVPGEATRIAQAIMSVADNPLDVKTVSGVGIAFEVPDELAAKLDLKPNDEQEQPEEISTKKRTRKGNS